jgi:ABC-type lipoprotein release transport system permease subunit
MFKLILKTAILSLFRRKARTFLAIFMIAASLWGLMLMLGIYDGMMNQMVDNALRSDSGDVTIYKKGFRSDREVQKQLKDTTKLIQKIKQNQAIKSYTKRVLSDGLLATSKYSKGVKIFGINLEDEKKQASLHRYIKDGVYDFGAKDKGAIIGYTLAKKLKLKVGKKIILSAQDANNEISSIALKITAIIKTNNMHIDGVAVFISQKKAQKFLNIDGVMQISMMFSDKSLIPAFKNDIIQNFPNLEVFSWDELYPALMQSKLIMEKYSLVSYVLIFFVAGIGIFGVVLVSVLERLREFAILQAIGTPFSKVSQIIFLESIFIGLGGFLLGSLLGGSTLYYFYIYGLDLSSFSDALDEFGMDAITYAVIKTSYFTTGFLAVIIAVGLSVIFPLHILKKSKPIEVING